ncbi:MAG TPA: hypothetical protein VMT20_02890 [Terriglobia bacterium]|nr:hypothetical protein [Terriglobia bacterium]
MSHSSEFESSPGGLSKRAAQRLIQRALVLAGRSRNVRQHIREADFASVWSIDDWGLEWAVAIRHGKLDFDRRLPHRPDIRVSWPTAESFFQEADAPRLGSSLMQYEGPPGARRMWDIIHQEFRAALADLLQNPVDQDGRSLV